MNLVDLYHQHAHRAPSDPEDTVFVTLTQRDTILVCFGLLLAKQMAPCLSVETDEVMEKLYALLVEQKQGAWRQG